MERDGHLLCAGETETRRSPLPEELVEYIIAMMPFPSIFKARTLSKGWAAKFSYVVSQEDEKVEEGKEQQQRKRLEQSPFQKQVVTRSHNWDAYCPAFLRKDTFEVIAFHRNTGSWQRLHSLGYLPGDFVLVDITVEGSLACGSVVSESSKNEHNLYVTNMLTRSWRVLPVRPNMTYVGCKHLLCRGPDAYMVVVFSLDPQYRQLDKYRFDAQVYDSTLLVWKTTKVTIENDFYISPHCSAYHDGTLYIASRHGLGVLTSGQIGILALNVEDMSWERCNLSFPPLLRPCTSVTLVKCAGQILVVLSLDVEPRSSWLNAWDETDHPLRLSYSNTQQSLLVMKLDLKSRNLVVVTQGPPETLCAGAVHHNPVTDGSYIYFGSKTTSLVLAYNVEHDCWSSLPSVCRASGINRGFQWSAFAFRPGLNSFLAV